MFFERVEPSPSIAHWIECFWIIRNDDPKQVIQKIVPDGFPEIIFHFGEPYEINLKGKWERQAANLLAGQIRKYFWLRNTGPASMLGIKLKPSTLTHAFGINMSELTDSVEDIDTIKTARIQELKNKVRCSRVFDDCIENISRFLEQILYERNSIDDALDIIFKSRGMNSVSDLVNSLGISERQWERIFKKYIGLSPKFYSRVIRFSTIFQLKEQGDPRWIDLTHEAGFADQSHFIRNFKSFTGEDPSEYGFDEKNIANFFMKKK